MAELGVAALQSVQILCKAVDNIKGVPDEIRSIIDDLESLEPVLKNLAMAYQNDSTQITLSSEIQTAVENCDRSCEDLRTTINRWTRHSTSDGLVWVDKWRMGLFGQEKIKAIKGQLNGYKSTLNVALSTASIINTTRQQCFGLEMRETMLKQQETMLRTEFMRAQEQGNGVETALQRLSVHTDSELDQASEQSRQELIHELRQQQASNDAFRSICEQMVSKSVEERTGQKIKGVKATEDSTALAGFINTTGEESIIKQDISDVTAEKGSFAGAGVIKNFDFKDMRLRDRSRALPTLTLDAKSRYRETRRRFRAYPLLGLVYITLSILLLSTTYYYYLDVVAQARRALAHGWWWEVLIDWLVMCISAITVTYILFELLSSHRKH